MRKHTASFVGIPFAFLLIASPAAAQICRGGLPFAASAIQGQAGIEVEDGSTVFGVSGGKGGQRWYGLGSLGIRTYEARDGSTLIFGFGGGRTFQVPLTGKAHHCLEIRGDFGTGPDAPGPVRADESSSSMTFEWTAGVPLSPRSALAVTPYGGLAARYHSVVTQGDQVSVANKDFYEFATIGVGLTVSGDFALQPYAQFPLSRDAGNDPVFGMRLSLRIGAPPR